MLVWQGSLFTFLQGRIRQSHASEKDRFPVSLCSLHLLILPLLLLLLLLLGVAVIVADFCHYRGFQVS